MAYNDIGRVATNKYRSKFDVIQIRVPKGDRDKIANQAKKRGESMNTFINRAIKEAMKNEKE